MADRRAFFTTTGTAAELAVTCGFRPVRIILHGANGGKLEWNDSMSNGSAFKTIGSTGVRTLITSDGITQDPSGFTVGADGEVNTSQAITVEAW